MKRAAVSVLATAATLYLVTAYDGSPLANADGKAGTTAADSGTSNALTAPTDNAAATDETTTTAAPAEGGAKKTVTGSSVETGYGTLKVTLTVEGTKLTNVTGTQTAANSTTKGITASAFPKLQTQALQKQNANVDNVSGATQTADGFKTSLAAAIKSAGI